MLVIVFLDPLTLMREKDSQWGRGEIKKIVVVGSGGVGRLVLLN